MLCQSLPSTTHLPDPVVFESLVIELFQDLFGSRVFANLAVEIKGDHVAGADGSCHTESLLQAFFFRFLHLGFGHADDEANRRVRVVFLVVLCKVRVAFQ